MSHVTTEGNFSLFSLYCFVCTTMKHQPNAVTLYAYTHTHIKNLLPAGGSVTRLQVMDNVKQSSDPVLVGCQAGLHSLKPLL